MPRTVSSDFYQGRDENNAIVFMHSRHFDPSCWAGWMKFYRSKGYDCYAPPWPGHVKSSDGHDHAQALTLSEIALSYESFIENKLPQRPILVGHGAGALIALFLASRGYAKKCILLGMEHVRSWSMIRYQWQAFRNRLLHRDSSIIPSFVAFRQVYANGSSSVRAETLYRKLMVRENIHTIRNIRNRSESIFYYGFPVCPLFFVSGALDKVSLAGQTDTHFIQYHAHVTGNFHRVLAGFDHVQLLEEGFLYDVGMFIDVWLSLPIGEEMHQLFSLGAN